jgi:hypothetical protein
MSAMALTRIVTGASALHNGAALRQVLEASIAHDDSISDGIKNLMKVLVQLLEPDPHRRITCGQAALVRIVFEAGEKKSIRSIF